MDASVFTCWKKGVFSGWICKADGNRKRESVVLFEFLLWSLSLCSILKLFESRSGDSRTLPFLAPYSLSLSVSLDYILALCFPLFSPAGSSLGKVLLTWFQKGSGFWFLVSLDFITAWLCVLLVCGVVCVRVLGFSCGFRLVFLLRRCLENVWSA